MFVQLPPFRKRLLSFPGDCDSASSLPDCNVNEIAKAFLRDAQECYRSKGSGLGVMV